MCVEGSQKSCSSELQTSMRKESASNVSFKWQMTIQVGIEKTNELSIQWSNDTGLEMAITDFSL